MSAAHVLYREEQRFRQWWVWLLVIGAAAATWWLLIQQIVLDQPVGSNPGPDWLVWVLWVLIGLGLPLLFYRLGLVLEVIPDQVIVRYRPFTTRVIPIANIEGLEVRSYSAIKEYGGWGIKGWSRRKMAYNVSGDQGVELTLDDGRLVMLGSQQPQRLAQAIESQRSGGRRST